MNESVNISERELQAAIADSIAASEPVEVSKVPGIRRIITSRVLVSLQLGLDIAAVVFIALLADRWSGAVSGSVVAPIVLLFAFVNLLALRHLGLYRITRLISWPLQMRGFLLLAAFNLALVGGTALWAPSQWGNVVAWSAVMAGGSFLLMWLSRYFFAALIRLGLRKGVLGEAVALIGSGKSARAFVQATARHAPHSWWQVVGVFDDRSPERGGGITGVPLLGRITDVAPHVRKGLLQHIVIALPWNAEIRFDEVRRKLASLPVALSLTWDDSRRAEAPNIKYATPVSSQDAEVPLLAINGLPSFGWAAIVKWVEDKLLASIALLLLSPVLLAVAIVIRLDSPGPILFRQKRYGFNQEPIMVYKFRTMFHAPEGSEFRQATKNDSRITRVGRFLRRTSLDELPQLFNVIEGNMSLVGPRPHPIELEDHFRAIIDGLDERHSVKPGITGWAQINGFRGETDTLEKMEARIAHDICYIENWSLWLDLKILFRTAVGGWTDQNAY